MVAYFYKGVMATNNKQYKVRHLTMNDIEHILQLQELVVQTLDNQDILQPLSYDEYQYIMNGKGMIIGAFADDRLIAFRALLIPPSDDAEHLGLDVGLKEEELPTVIYQEISNVHPDYRGNRLQQKLAQLIMNELSALDHSFKYVCCTVMPSNIPSLKDKLAQGMVIAALKEKYQGRLRYVLVKKLHENTCENWTDTTALPINKIKEQQTLLKEGWLGFTLQKDEEHYKVVYGKI